MVRYRSVIECSATDTRIGPAPLSASTPPTTTSCGPPNPPGSNRGASRSCRADTIVHKHPAPPCIPLCHTDLMTSAVPGYRPARRVFGVVGPPRRGVIERCDSEGVAEPADTAEVTVFGKELA